jgi:hypothetical protein
MVYIKYHLMTKLEKFFIVYFILYFLYYIFILYLYTIFIFYIEVYSKNYMITVFILIYFS